MPRLVGTFEGAGETTVTVHLRKPEPVEEVWLLASRGGEKRDRGTTRVHVDFVDDDGTRTVPQEVDLFDYPRWTVVWHEAWRLGLLGHKMNYNTCACRFARC